MILRFDENSKSLFNNTENSLQNLNCLKLPNKFKYFKIIKIKVKKLSLPKLLSKNKNYWMNNYIKNILINKIFNQFKL